MKTKTKNWKRKKLLFFQSLCSLFSRVFLRVKTLCGGTIFFFIILSEIYEYYNIMRAAKIKIDSRSLIGQLYLASKILLVFRSSVAVEIASCRV